MIAGGWTTFWTNRLFTYAPFFGWLTGLIILPVIIGFTLLLIFVTLLEAGNKSWGR